jgi:CheY-like chemotaxis protein
MTHVASVTSTRGPRRSSVETYRLLLVEDDRDALIAGAHLLEDAGFVVEVAKTASDGIVKAAALRPDLIVTDLMMPDIGGEEFVRELRRRRATRHTPVIVYTAVTEVEQLAPLVRLKVRVFAIKPCLPTVIAAEARRLLAAGRKDAGVRVLTGYGDTLDELAERLSTLP